MSKFDPILPLTHTDAYKIGHHLMEYPGSEYSLANFTPRGSRDPKVTHIVNFGLQYFIKSWLEKAWKPFFAADEDEVAALYEEFTTSVLGPNNIGSDHIRALHRLGYLPLKFRALPEGALVPLRVPFFTVENTHPEFYWLVNYIETALSASIWHPATSATLANELRKLFDTWAIKTTGSTAGVQWQAHDFGFRGQSGIESASSSGMGHLLSFTGSDTLSVLPAVEDNYPGDNGLILGSVAATEHSLMTVGGNATGDEQSTYERLLEQVPTGILSIVSDTWDLWNVLTNILPNIKDQILARDGKVVIRPDSGDPVDILTGLGEHPEALKLRAKVGEDPNARPWEKGVIELLWDVFGGTVNEQGYKVLDSHIGAIYGDSITAERAEQIFERLEAKGFASTNVVLGMGSWFYNGIVTRDTFGFAYKNTYAVIDGVGRELQKDPITDNGLKKSAKGRIAVIWENDDYVLVDDSEAAIRGANSGSKLEGGGRDMLKTVWENGEFVKYYSFAEVRENLHPEGL